MTLNFRDLRTWEGSQKLIEKIYQMTTNFPADEKFGLTSQIKRAAISVAANIAEGMGRGSTKDLMRFLIMARGSLHETLSHLETAKRLIFISKDEFESLTSEYNGLLKGINAHLNSLRGKPLPLFDQSPIT